jgi:REP element-mobilizing transposase RayT
MRAHTSPRLRLQPSPISPFTYLTISSISPITSPLFPVLTFYLFTSFVKVCYDARMEQKTSLPLKRVRSVRLVTAPTHDLWGTGRYFATMVTARRKPCLSTIVSGGYAQWTSIGKRIDASLTQLSQAYPIAIDRAALMPDHLHLCFRVTKPLTESILRILVKWRKEIEEATGFSQDDPLWETPYHLFTPFNREVYTRCIDYTAANPRRWWHLRNNPNLLQAQNVTHPLLSTAYTWQAVGHLDLLNAPLMMSIRIHRTDTEATINALTERAIHIAQAGGVIIGGFVSPTEKALLKKLYATVPDVKLISLLPHTLSDYKPAARVLDAFYQGRRLLLTTASDHPSTTPCTRTVCLRHNDLAEQIAHQAQGKGR